ncbi:hypothetical protein NIA70_20305, partial [[Clostridium] scindens]|uniref:hypothetical protein n=1 Tax=Clostridium scindens (strain JCM 10418 / VPI 12708) TaxID=29347 RepID=UPI0020969615
SLRSSIPAIKIILWRWRKLPTSKFPDGNFSQAAPRGARLSLCSNSRFAAVFNSRYKNNFMEMAEIAYK